MSNPLATISEHVNPPYDRNVDVVWWRGVEANAGDEFMRSLPDLKIRRNKQQNGKMIFFSKLTVSIRRKIYAFVYEHPASGKHVNLSKDFTTKDVFPPDFFITPWDLLRHAEGALSSCVQLRDEIYTYFWNTYHFHVTFSPYSIGAFSGLSIRLLNAYAHRVNHLTVEVDMTRLAFSAAKDAALLKQSNTKMQKVIFNLVIALGHRRHKANIMTSLTLLARRYVGFRPAATDAPGDKDVPYCPDKALFLFDCFCELKPLVLQCRMSGFSIWYTRQLLREILIPPFLTKPRPAPIIPAWPHYIPAPVDVVFLSNISTVASAGSTTASTSGNSPRSITGNATYYVDKPNFRNIIPSFGCSQAGSSVGSFAPLDGHEPSFHQVRKDSSGESKNHDLVELRNTPSVSSINTCVSSVEDVLFIGSNINTARYLPTSRASPASMVTSGFNPGSKTTPHASIFSANNPISRIPAPRGGTTRSFRCRNGYSIPESGNLTTEPSSLSNRGLGISLKSMESSSFADEINAELKNRGGFSPPARKDSLPDAAKSPSTVDELNELNEMDPAFTRAVEGLRMASEDRGEAEEQLVEGGETSKAEELDKRGKKRDKTKQKKTSRKHWF